MSHGMCQINPVQGEDVHAAQGVQPVAAIMPQQSRHQGYQPAKAATKAATVSSAASYSTPAVQVLTVAYQPLIMIAIWALQHRLLV